jgi:predicted nucleic-acid-binding protein
MKIGADTNLLLRAAVRDDAQQAITAARVLRTAELVAVPVAALREFAWLMRSLYKKPALEVARSIRSLVASPNVVTQHPAVEAGLAVLDMGGDFADGAIAYEGRWLGAEEFVSFDKQTVTILRSQGHKARLLS